MSCRLGNRSDPGRRGKVREGGGGREGGYSPCIMRSCPDVMQTREQVRPWQEG